MHPPLRLPSAAAQRPSTLLPTSARQTIPSPNSLRAQGLQLRRVLHLYAISHVPKVIIGRDESEDWSIERGGVLKAVSHHLQPLPRAFGTGFLGLLPVLAVGPLRIGN